MNNISEIEKLNQDFLKTNINALSSNWIISPLDYFWTDGKMLFDKVFLAPHNNQSDGLIISELYKMTMQCDFRAKMMVLCYMKEPIVSQFSLEIENGLLHFYGLDFVSTISQWIYVFEGIIRDMFGLNRGNKITNHVKWNKLTAINPEYQELLNAFVESIKNFTKNILFERNENLQSTLINRHLLSHGKVYNKEFYSQENCLKLLFALDTLLMIEMLKNGSFPKVFSPSEIENNMIDRRNNLYVAKLQMVFDEYNLLKNEIMKQHLVWKK